MIVNFCCLVVSIGIVFAVPAPVPDVNAPVDGSSGGRVGCDSNGVDKQQLQICKNPNDIACFFQVNDPRRNGAINTKIQSDTYETYYRLKCSRGQKFDSLYTLAADQTSAKCKDAIDFSELD